MGQRMFAALVDAGGDPQNLLLAPARRRGGRMERRLAFGKRARLVDDQRIDLAQALDGRRVAEQDALGGAPAGSCNDLRLKQPGPAFQAILSQK